MDALDQIGAEASQLENEQEQAAIPPEEQAQETPSIDPALAWAQLPKMLGGILAMAFPSLDGVYTDQKCLAWGASMAAVSDKYGWDAGETMAKFGPEIALVATTLPLLVPTVKVIKKALDDEKKKQPIEGEGLIKEAGSDEQK